MGAACHEAIAHFHLYKRSPCGRCRSSTSILTTRALSDDVAQAHAMLPHQGAGAGQAIEVTCSTNPATTEELEYFPSIQDAYILASLLGETNVTLASLPLALEAYEHIRLPNANHVQLASRESGLMYEFGSAFGEDYAALGPAIENQWGWLWDGSAEEDVKRGLDWMGASRDGGMQLT